MKLMPFHKVSSIWYLVSGIRNTKYKQSLRSSSLRTAGLKIQNTKYCKSFGFTLIELLVACHPKPWRRKAILGFTLIELLVAITIISTLVSIGTFAFNNTLDKGRDSRRKSDLAAIKSDLILYYQDNDFYPPDCPPTHPPCSSDLEFPSDTSSDPGGDPSGPWLPTDLVPYIQKLPKDPSQAANFVISRLATNLKDLVETVLKNLVTPPEALAAATTPHDPTSAVQDTSKGVAAWLNYTYVFSSNDAFATFTTNINDRTAYLIKATGFNFSSDVPSGNIIDGIEVRVKRHSLTASTFVDGNVLIVKGNTPQGTDHADTATFWPTADAYKTYGGATDTWGVSWTADDIRAANFGVAFTATHKGTLNARAYVDHIQIIVYHHAPAPPTVNIFAGSTNIPYNSSTTLTWNTTDATSCTASANPASSTWTGSKATNNMSPGESTGPLINPTNTFTLNCSGPGGPNSHSVTLNVGAPAPPTVNIFAGSTNIPYNSSTTLTWNTTDATSCTASANPASSTWTGSKATKNMTPGESTGPLINPTNTFTLNCSGPGGPNSHSVTLNVGAPAPPTVNIFAGSTNIPYNSSTTLTW